MAYTYPTVNDFKNYFTRDFPYGTDPSTSILDSDISRAQTESKVNFNSALFSSQEEFGIMFNLLSAHYLVTNIRNSSQGISGKFDWLTSGKGAGSVNESFSIPDRILANPEYAWLSKTNYGTQYLSMLLPRLVGQIFTVDGGTNP